MILLIIALAPVVLYAVWKLYKNNHYWRDQNVLEVKSWPVVGSMLGYLTRQNFGEWLEDIYNTYDARYFGIYSFMSPVLLIKDLDLIKQMVVKDFDTFVDHRSFFTETEQAIVKDNLFSLKGDSWRHMRSTLSPAFTGSKMRIMFNLMKDCADQFTDYFVVRSKYDKPTTFNMKDIFSRYGNDVIATCGFGVSCNSLVDRNNDFYLRGQDVASFDGTRAIKFILFSAFPELMNFLKIKLYSVDLMNFFRNLFTTTVNVRERNNIYRPDMIQLLMQAQKGQLKYEEIINDVDTGFATAKESKYGTETSTIKRKLTEDELVGQIFLFLIAGFETTSTVLAFTAYELAINEHVQKKLQDEVDKIMKACNGNLNYDELVKMQYLDMVVTESLRLWNPVYFLNRICSKPYTIPAAKEGEKPLHLKPNDVFWVPSYMIMRDPKNYPNPLKFDPERFNEENKKNVNLTSFLPFGIGPRNCIGSRFALLEMKILITYLMWKFDFVVVKETNVPVQISKTSLLLQSVDGINLGFKLRQK